MSDPFKVSTVFVCIWTQNAKDFNFEQSTKHYNVQSRILKITSTTNYKPYKNFHLSDTIKLQDFYAYFKSNHLQIIVMKSLTTLKIHQIYIVTPSTCFHSRYQCHSPIYFNFHLSFFKYAIAYTNYFTEHEIYSIHKLTFSYKKT